MDHPRYLEHLGAISIGSLFELLEHLSRSDDLEEGCIPAYELSENHRAPVAQQKRGETGVTPLACPC